MKQMPQHVFIKVKLSARHARSLVRASVEHGGVCKPWRRMTPTLKGSRPALLGSKGGERGWGARVGSKDRERGWGAGAGGDGDMCAGGGQGVGGGGVILLFERLYAVGCRRARDERVPVELVVAELVLVGDFERLPFELRRRGREGRRIYT